MLKIQIVSILDLMDCRVKTGNGDNCITQYPDVSILDLMDCRVKTRSLEDIINEYIEFQSLI